MKRTFTLGSLQQFLFMSTNNPQESMMNPPGFLFENADNQHTELGKLIQMALPVVEEALKPVRDLVQEHNKRVAKIKNSHSDTVTMVENNNSSGKTLTYTMTGDNANKMNDEIGKSLKKLETERKVVEATSAEIDVTWAKQEPVNLKPYFKECFKGIVLPDGQPQIIKP